MAKKISSAILNSDAKKHLIEKYDEIFSDISVWKYSKFDGLHAIICWLLHKKLEGSRVLDVGCGAGRLSLYLSIQAREVVGIDPSVEALKKAKFFLGLTRQKNIRFELSTLNEIKNDCFDIIIFAGVLEHVSSPIDTLKKAQKLLSPGGVIVISCPAFLNFRGHIYNTLFEGFHFPMSLADLRQVDFMMVQEWAEESRLKLMKVYGALYNLGWGNSAVNDLIERIPKVLKDKKNDEIDVSSLNRWLVKENRRYNTFLKFLDRYLLKPVKLPTLQLYRPDNINNAEWQDVKTYFQKGFIGDLRYCQKQPFSYWGGECIYLLKSLNN